MAVSEQDINKLYQQLQDAYREISRLQQQSNTAADKMQENLRKLTANMQQSTNQLQTELIERWKKLESDMCSAYVREVEEMRKPYQSLLDNVAELEKQYKNAINDLEQEQKQIISDKEQKEHQIRDIALEQEELFQQALNRAYQQPVEAFHPHSIDDYRKAGERARQLMQEGLFSLAANDFSNCCMGIVSITEYTKKKVKDIELMFELYKSLISRIEVINTAPWELRDTNNDVYLSLENIEDIDYWSDMLFSELSHTLEAHKRIVSEGVLEWIHKNANKGTSPELLLDYQIRSLEYIPDQFQMCISYALSAYDCYNHLFDIRDAVTVAMSEQNYYYDRTTFGVCKTANMDSNGYKYYQQWLKDEECLVPGEKPDYREERCIQFINLEGNVCRVHIVPIRNRAIVSYNVYIESISDKLPGMVEHSLRVILDNALNNYGIRVAIYNVEEVSNINHTLQYDELKVLTATPDEHKLRAKYCIGV